MQHWNLQEHEYMLPVINHIPYDIEKINTSNIVNIPFKRNSNAIVKIQFISETIVFS